LTSICIPSSVEILGAYSFNDCASLSSLTFEFGSQLRQIGGSAFCGCYSLRWVFIPSSVEILGEKCFSGCSLLSICDFEQFSHLNRIETEVFSCCASLSSLWIPSSVCFLATGWNLASGMQTVTFESAASLQAMLEDGDADLDGEYRIEIGDCDCELDLSAYSISPDRYKSRVL
jgi:hypothetical protein